MTIQSTEKAFYYQESSILGKNAITFRKEDNGFLKILVWENDTLLTSFYMSPQEFGQLSQFMES